MKKTEINVYGKRTPNKDQYFDIDTVVYNVRTRAIGIVRANSMIEGITLTDADGWVNSSELEKYEKQQGNISNSTQREIKAYKLK
jgi:hypothetical protein